MQRWLSANVVILLRLGVPSIAVGFVDSRETHRANRRREINTGVVHRLAKLSLVNDERAERSDGLCTTLENGDIIRLELLGNSGAGLPFGIGNVSTLLFNGRGQNPHAVGQLLSLDGRYAAGRVPPV